MAALEIKKSCFHNLVGEKLPVLSLHCNKAIFTEQSSSWAHHCREEVADLVEEAAIYYV